MGPTPLPHNLYPFDSDVYAAYERCRELERATTVEPMGRLTPLVGGRVLGYMLIHAPVEEGRVNVQREITSRDSQKQLIELAKLYIDTYIRIFKGAKAIASTKNSHSSQLSLDFDREVDPQSLAEAMKNHADAERMGLKRDSFRCLTSGILDSDVYHQQKKRTLRSAHLGPTPKHPIYSRTVRIKVCVGEAPKPLESSIGLLRHGPS
ncbi:hypothetical protein FRB94_012743 [Tulasnella sp. JGI-2019a]|nr:hypothetical protein FRB94_012743 [Tulasnella sp. JGI-2019a]KAG9018455.1 hypothetical protein FRB93_000158 [Tulasnella sp. JGI-2019a]